MKQTIDGVTYEFAYALPAAEILDLCYERVRETHRHLSDNEVANMAEEHAGQLIMSLSDETTDRAEYEKGDSHLGGEG